MFFWEGSAHNESISVENDCHRFSKKKNDTVDRTAGSQGRHSGDEE